MNSLVVLATFSGVIMLIYGMSSSISLWTTAVTFKLISAPLYSSGFEYANDYINITGFVAGIFEAGFSLGFIASTLLTPYLLKKYGSEAVLWQIAVATMCQA